MDSRYRFLMLGIPWTQSMLSLDVNAATRLAEAGWRHHNGGQHAHTSSLPRWRNLAYHDNME